MNHSKKFTTVNEFNNYIVSGVIAPQTAYIDEIGKAVVPGSEKVLCLSGVSSDSSDIAGILSSNMGWEMYTHVTYYYRLAGDDAWQSRTAISMSGYFSGNATIYIKDIHFVANGDHNIQRDVTVDEIYNAMMARTDGKISPSYARDTIPQSAATILYVMCPIELMVTKNYVGIKNLYYYDHDLIRYIVHSCLHRLGQMAYWTYINVTYYYSTDNGDTWEASNARTSYGTANASVYATGAYTNYILFKDIKYGIGQDTTPNVTIEDYEEFFSGEDQTYYKYEKEEKWNLL